MKFRNNFSLAGCLLTAALPLCLMAAGCGQTDSNALAQDQAFLSVAHALDATVASKRDALGTSSVPTVGQNETFYLAINKSELGKRYFLSAYIKQLFPGGVASGIYSIGTRVVTFRVQNGKLFVFDASDNFAVSDTIDPSVIIEAYPIITDNVQFNGRRNSDHYVLFDPSAGLNRFGVFSDAFETGGAQPEQFQVDLSYMQNYRDIADGATFEQVFAGSGNQQMGDGSLEPNVLKASGTLGLALRAYKEGAGFTDTPLYVDPATGETKEFYFRSDTHLVKNGSSSYQTAVKYNVHPGMTPITYLISDHFKDVQAQYPQYDIIGAVTKGIENWNAVFGYPVLKAKMATANDTYSNDDENYVIYDADTTLGYAYADWRTNPNSGEIRGASVYFSGIWFQGLDDEFSDDPGASTTTTGTASPSKLPAHKAHAKVAHIGWGSMHNDPLCVLWADDGARGAALAAGDAAVAPSAAPAYPPMTKKQKIEAYITHIILHEVGHTLGLRHNFKGSLIPATSSVMDYVVDADSVHAPTPQAYDIAAIKYLYGQSTAAPTQPFCTDEDEPLDPLCVIFDRYADPLTNYWGKYYTLSINQLQSFDSYLSLHLFAFIRVGTPAQALQAWKTAIAPFAVPADAKRTSDPAYVALVNSGASSVFGQLFLAAPADRDDASDPGRVALGDPTDPVVLAAALQQAKANLTNDDKIRTYALRRQMVDVLKHYQSQEALDALTAARVTITAARKGMTGTDASDTDDLLARINQALNPYFIN